MSALVAFIFLGLAGISLDQAYRDSTEKALEEQLQANLYILLANAEDDEKGHPKLPFLLSAPNFNIPDSGFYAEVVGIKNSYRWRSRSLLDRVLKVDLKLKKGEIKIKNQNGLWIIQQWIGWDDLSGKSVPYVFAVALEANYLLKQHQTFRATLWVWLSVLGALLLFVQIIFVKWGLSPLKKIANIVQDIEKGSSSKISGQIPIELKPLTENLNSLLKKTQGRQERLRNFLADLSHSLKTPLAILRSSAVDEKNSQLSEQVELQTTRIDQIITYQKQRLLVAGSSPMTQPSQIKPILERICEGLSKVYYEKKISYLIDVHDDFCLKVDKNDLFELFGNLLENAFKYSSNNISISLKKEKLYFENDGSGIEEEKIKKILIRGERGDEKIPGEGIGLSIVQEIVEQNGGEIEVEKSPLGGLKISLNFN